MSKKRIFTVHIELGNEAMRKKEHVARLLRELASLVENGAGGGKLKDINGNTVGRFDLDEVE